MPKTLRLILGDQLNSQHSWLSELNPDHTYLLMEMRQETDYVRHHIQKIMAFFQAMRYFASSLKQAGHQVMYYRISDKENQQNLIENIESIITNGAFEAFEYQLPDEYRLDQQLKKWASEKAAVPVTSCDTEHFYTEREELKILFKNKKTFLMERFYRHMRKKHQVMMDGDEPKQGKWNFDHDNRSALPKDQALPQALVFDQDLQHLHNEIDAAGIDYIGSVDARHFPWPLNRKEGLALLDYFCEHLLPHFGRYQDAMTHRDPFLFHSRLSFLMNSKILSPKEVVNRVIDHWQAHPSIGIAQVEGFVRQIIGWREFMRGVYWAKMPDYRLLNALNHQEKLPSWYWTGHTKMECLKQSIGQSLEHAYAHHIQRLMVTGNFALLAHCHPDEVDAWYLGIYIDAIEWVEITNTRGMSQFADGGIVGTKPYISSANYIDKMSDYCSSCHYIKSKKVGEKACPFNSLYWLFYEKHREKLSGNPRIGMMYRTLDRLKNKDELLEQAQNYLKQIDDL